MIGQFSEQFVTSHDVLRRINSRKAITFDARSATPRKTFAGAISKTVAKGEINCLDPGGFGAVTITKLITINCENTLGGIQAAGTTGVIVNVLGTDVVTLKGLDIEGALAPAPMESA